MKKTISLLLIFLSVQIYAQKIIEKSLSFTFIQLPLQPLDEEITSYQKELIFSNEEALLRSEDEAKQLFAKEEAEYEDKKAQAQADFEYINANFEQYIEDAQREHDIKLEAYEKTLGTMGLLQKLEYKERNPPPKFVMPRRPTSPEYVSKPYYKEPKGLDVLSKKDAFKNTFLELEGYEESTENAVLIKAEIYEADIKDPVTETSTERYYDKVAKTYRNRTITTRIIEAKQPILLELIDLNTGKIIFSEVIAPDYASFINTDMKAVETNILDNNLNAVQNTISSNFAFAKKKRVSNIMTVMNKKYEYPEFTEAYELAMKFYNSTDFTDESKIAELNKAIAIWEEQISIYNPDEKGSKLSDDIIIHTYLNLAEAYAWLNNYEKAMSQLVKVESFKLDKDQTSLVESFKPFLNKQRERYLANN